MKAVGLITEYNPMHQGHVYHLNQAKKITGADVSIVVMSGDFVQRGEPAFIHKYARAKACIDAGVNLVVELPSYYALSSAEGFATGAIKTLSSLMADSVVFGSESGNLPLLKAVADIIGTEPEEYRILLKNALAAGQSFPLARQSAMEQYLKHSKEQEKQPKDLKKLTYTEEELAEILSFPNNILGIEYLKAIAHFAKDLKPYTIERIGSSYHETGVIADEMPSATAIRGILEHWDSSSLDNKNASDCCCNNEMPLSETEIARLKQMMPDSMADQILTCYGSCCPVIADDFTPLLNYKLSQIFYQNSYDKKEIALALSSYVDISIDLANRIADCYDGKLSFSELTAKIKTRQYTYSRISRCLFHILLDMTKVRNGKYSAEQVPYIRILGFDENGQKYLGHIKKKCKVPIITKPADNKDLLNEDVYISGIYNQIVNNRFHTTLKDEYRAGIYMPQHQGK